MKVRGSVLHFCHFCLFVNSVRILYLGFSSLGIFMVLGGFIYIYIYILYWFNGFLFVFVDS